jgi:malate dehydrogenase (quinone)
VSGQWLKCTNPDVIAKHKVKVYGKASVGAPPMSVPHIDSRMINGKTVVIWTFCWFSTRFLKMVPILICLYL